MKIFSKLRVYCNDFMVQLPERNNEDLGFDIKTLKDVVIKPNSVCEIGTGMCFVLPRWKGITLQTRSSLARKGLIVVGGIIDSSFTGEVKVLVYNSSNEEITIELGKKFCQFLLVNTPSNSFIQKVSEFFKDFFVIDEFERATYTQLLEKQRNSVRKSNGFGSTDVKK